MATPVSVPTWSPLGTYPKTRSPPPSATPAALALTPSPTRYRPRPPAPMPSASKPAAAVRCWLVPPSNRPANTALSLQQLVQSFSCGVVRRPRRLGASCFQETHQSCHRRRGLCPCSCNRLRFSAQSGCLGNQRRGKCAFLDEKASRFLLSVRKQHVHCLAARLRLPRAQQEEIDLMAQRGCNQQIRLCRVIRDGLHRDK